MVEGDAGAFVGAGAFAGAAGGVFVVLEDPQAAKPTAAAATATPATIARTPPLA